MKFCQVVLVGLMLSFTASVRATEIDVRIDFSNKAPSPGANWNTVTAEGGPTAALDYHTGVPATTASGTVMYKLGHNGSGSMTNDSSGNWDSAKPGPLWLDSSKNAANDAMKGSNAVGWLLTFSGLDPNQLYDVEVVSSYKSASWTDPADGFTITATGDTVITRTGWKAYASGYQAGNWLSWLQFKPKADGTITISSPGGIGSTAGVINAARLTGVRPNDFAPPARVTDLAAPDASIQRRALTLTWTAPADPSGWAEDVVSYDLRCSTAAIDDTNWGAATPVSGVPAPAAPGIVQSCPVTALTADTTYFFALKSTDNFGNVSLLSNLCQARTLPPDVTPPGAVTDLSGSIFHVTNIILTWTATADDGYDAASGSAAAYDLRYSTTPFPDAGSDQEKDAWFAAAAQVSGLPVPQAPGSAETFTVSGLQQATTYYFAIKAIDVWPNTSAISNVFTIATLGDTTPPNAVTDLMGGLPTPQSVTLQWTTPADVGPAGVAGYDLRYSTTSFPSGGTSQEKDAWFAAATQVTGEPAPATPGTAVTYTVNSLTASTTYSFAIKSYDWSTPVNTSAISNVAVISTTSPRAAVTIHNPWIVNDRVADTHNIGTMGATYVNAYTPDGTVLPTTDEQKAINIYNNQKRRLYHWTDEPVEVGGNGRDPTYNQNVFGWALCGSEATQGLTIAKSAGFNSRFIGIDPGGNAHNIYEVFYDNAWHLFDTMTTMYVYSKTLPRHIASAAEIDQDPSIMLDALADGRACPGYLLCGDTLTYYISAIHNWGASSPSQSCSWTGNMDLRMGQTFKRTWESWIGQHPTPTTESDSLKTVKDPPYHHEAGKPDSSNYTEKAYPGYVWPVWPRGDKADTVNYPYWEPYALDSTQNLAINIGAPKTFRRWANGVSTVPLDFRSAGASTYLESNSTNIATYAGDGISPDLHAATTNTDSYAIIQFAVPYYLTDATLSGDFVRATSSDTCVVSMSTDNVWWTTMYTVPAGGTTHLSNFSLHSFIWKNTIYGIPTGLWSKFYIKIQIRGASSKANAGVSNLCVTTSFEHNKGAMAYLDKGVNHITFTCDNAADLAASGNVVHLTYKWKEYDGTNWTIDKQYDTVVSSSPATFTITTGGTKVPRTEYIAMEVVQPDTVPPAPIADVAVVPEGTTRHSVQLTWTATGDDNRLGTASRYDVRYSTSPIVDIDSFNAASPAYPPMPRQAGSSESFAVTGLAANTIYYFAVMAYDKGNNPSGLVPGSFASATTLVDPLPAPVTNLSAPASDVTKNSVRLTWTATGEDGTDGTAARYDLRYSTGTISDMDSFNAATAVAGLPAPQVSGSAETFTVTGLSSDTAYTFALVVYDAGNQPSGLSNVVAVRTLVDLPPAAVSDLAAPPAGRLRNSIQLTWTASGEDGAVGTAARYDLRYSTGTISDVDSFNAATPVAGLPTPSISGSAESFTVTGLAAATTYNFALVVYDAANQPSGLSSIVVASTSADLPPTAITDLSDLSDGVSRTSVQLTWTASGEDGSVGTASSYDLRYSTDPISDMTGFSAATQVTGLPAPKAAGQAETFTVDGLTIGTTYYFAIVVYDAANQPSALSNVLVAHTRKLGDVDADGQVNLADLKLLIAAWNSESGGAYANWNPDADLDNDNYVNLADLKILIAHWNQ